MSAEPRYTLAEAKRVLAEKRCGRLGHSLQIVERDGEPVALFCCQCGLRWSVVAETERHAELAVADASGRSLDVSGSREAGC